MNNSTTSNNEEFSSKKIISSDNFDPEKDDPTYTAEVEIEDIDQLDASRVILEDYERCLTKHGTSLGELLRLHQRESALKRKLTLNLREAVKAETEQRKKNKALDNAAEKLLQSVSQLTGQSPQTVSNPNERAEALNRAIDDLKRQIDDYRRRQEELDKQIDEAKRQVDENQMKLDLSKREEEMQNARQAQNAASQKEEMLELIRNLNRSLNLINEQHHKTYMVKEDCTSPEEVRRVLHCVLNDVIDAVNEHKRLTARLEELKAAVEENERHAEHARSMNEFLTEEARKLLLIGNKGQARDIDPQNYEAVRQYLEAVFQEAISELTTQNDELATRVQSKVSQDAKLDEERVGMEKEIALKQAKVDATKEALSRLGAQNAFLRQQLLQQRLERSGVVTHTSVGADPAVAASGSPPTEAATDEHRRQITLLTAAIEGNDAILAQKRRELQELHERREQERDAGAAKTRDLDARISTAQRQVDELARQLAQLDADSREAVELRAKLDRLQQTERQLDDGVRRLEAQLAEADRQQLALSAEAKQQLRDCEALRQRLRDEDLRRDTLEEKLQEARERVVNTERKLAKQKERTYIIERQVPTAENPKERR